MKKLKAFTLIEMLVAMIVTLIIAGITVMAYEVIQKRQEQFKKNNSVFLEVYNLYSLFQMDFAGASSVTNNAGEISFLRNDGKTVSYSFSEKDVIRKFQTVLDTFHVETKNVHSLFQKKESTANDGLMDELTFQVIVLDDSVPFHFTKQYDAAVLLKAENPNNERN